MKYTKVEPFEKHLEEALPDHPSRLYFLFMEDPFERSFLASRVAKALGLPKVNCAGDDLLEELQSPSLFVEKKVIICDEPIDKEIPEAEELILIITGKGPPPFYKGKEKEGVTLDLRGEKPWDRKDRLKRWLLEIARAGKKTLSLDGASFLVDVSDADFARLIQELEKAMVFAGEEKTITLQMLQTVSSIGPSQSGWQLSEGVVWGGPIHFGETDLYSLVGQLRYQLQLGLQIAEGKTPKASPKKVDKIRAKGLEASYYIKGLEHLFDLEMKMRSNITNQKLLFDYFRATLAKERNG